jgi:hypothetical protein
VSKIYFGSNMHVLWEWLYSSFQLIGCHYTDFSSVLVVAAKIEPATIYYRICNNSDHWKWSHSSLNMQFLSTGGAGGHALWHRSWPYLRCFSVWRSPQRDKRVSPGVKGMLLPGKSVSDIWTVYGNNSRKLGYTSFPNTFVAIFNILFPQMFIYFIQTCCCKSVTLKTTYCVEEGIIFIIFRAHHTEKISNKIEKSGS